jgi:fatty-acyl-CoA synthase
VGFRHNDWVYTNLEGTTMSNDKPWVDGLTYAEVLKKVVAEYGDREAVVFPQLDLRWTYTEFNERIRQMARALLNLGVTKGTHVGIWATNWPEWVLAQMSTGLIGAVLVNVNPAYRKQELAYIIGQAELSVLIITDAYLSSDYQAITAEVVPELNATPFGTPIENAEYPNLKHVACIKDKSDFSGIGTWSQFIEGAANHTDEEIDALSAQVTAQDPVNMQYTSGTTGAPKGAMLSHRNLLMNGFYGGVCQKITEIDRVCVPVPFYHCFGCVMGTLMSMIYGCTMVSPAEAFDPVATMKAISDEGCTVVYGVPTMFSAQVNDPSFSEYNFSTMRTGIMAGSPCPIELMKQVIAEMNLNEIVIAYGQTEASPIITMSHTTDSVDVRVNTVGGAIPDIEVRIVDPETGEDCPIGEQGELWSRGHGVMLGYYNMPEATANSVTPDGWLKTGDLATETPEHNYKITGRIKDLIIRGGENIYPREIEEFLLTHPDILEVQVVGLPDVKFIEQVSAWLKVKPGTDLTEADVKAFCKEKIAHYKIPYYVAIVDEFPLTVTGKIQKFVLRDMGIERFGLQEAAGTQTA